QRQSFARSGKSPLFPSYLFTQFDPMDTGWCSILKSPGTVTVIGVNRVMIGEHYPPPLPLPEGWVEGLRSHIDGLGGIVPRPVEPPRAKLRRGQKVFMVEGAFRGYSALVEADEGERVRLLLDIFGSGVRTMALRSSVATDSPSQGDARRAGR